MSKTAKKEAKNGWPSWQKFDAPDENDGTRIFYESLHRQKPNSKMAKRWCLEYGLLPEAEAKKVVKLLAK